MAHGIPTHDIYSYTAPNFPWINHEWLSDVVIAGFMKLGGYWFTAGAFALVWALAIVIAARTWKLPVVGIGFAAVMGLAVARPNAWTALFFAVTLLAIEKRWHWRLVPLFVLWANLHGGFVIGFVALAVAAWRDRKYIGVLAVSVLATFLNPYGPRLYVEIWRTLGDPQLHGRVTEWQPLMINWMSGFYIFLVLAAVISTGWKKYRYVLPALLLLGTLAGNRHFPEFVLGTLAILRDGYESGVRFLAIRGRKRWLVTCLAIFVMAGPAVRMALRPDNHLPDRQIADLRATPCAGQIYNDYDFGGYMIWKLPGVKVFIDGRMPSWRANGVSYYEKWYDVINSAEATKREFAQYGIKCAMLSPIHTRLSGQLIGEGWKVSSRDENGVLLRER